MKSLSEMYVNAVSGNEEAVKIIDQIHDDFLEAKMGSRMGLPTGKRKMANVSLYHIGIISTSSDDGSSISQSDSILLIFKN